MRTAFLSHRIDFLTYEEATATAELYRSLLSNLPIKIISMSDKLQRERELGISDEQLVQDALASLTPCDFVILDCSIHNWCYIGSICEMVYAYQMKKPIVAYVGNTDNGLRPWLRFHVTKVATSHTEVRQFCGHILDETNS